MVAAGALLCLLAAATPGSPALASGFTTPEPGMLAELRRRHRPGQLLGVTSGAERWVCRANDLDERGLVGLTSGRDPSPPTDPFPWSRIERIDIRTDRRTYGSVMGAIVGSLGGLLIPAIPGGYSTESWSPRNWLLGGALVGGFAGRALGARVLRERALYVAPVEATVPVVAERPRPVEPDSGQRPSPDASAATPADTMGSVVASPPPPSITPAASTPEVERALRRMSSGDLLRIEGPFGRFHGYASRADRGGLAGLRAEPRLKSTASLSMLTWPEIERIDMRGASAGQGALRGAVSVGGALGVLGALLGMAVQSLGGEGSAGAAAIAGGAIGVGVGAPVGALFGAVIGAGVPSWHKVYLRP